jgi:CBS domain-containing protein
VRVEHILGTKGGEVATIAPGAPVTDALRLLQQRNIGALVVMEDDRLVGLLSERDIVRSLARADYRMLAMRVRQVMTPNVITCTPDDDLQGIMAIMTHERARHLPVIGADGRLCGIISTGDVIKARLDLAEAEIRLMRDLYLASH